MNDQSVSDRVTAVVMAGLLILTALGNAVVMFVVSLIGLVVGLLFFRKHIA